MTQKPFSLLGGLKASQGIKKEPTDANRNAVEQAKPAAGNVPSGDSAGVPSQNESAKAENPPAQAPNRPSLLNVAKTAGAGGAVVQSGVDSKPANSVSSPKGSLLAGIQKATERAEARKEDHHYLFAEVPDDFQELLNRFDNLLIRDGQIDLSNIDTCRAYVKKIMVDLKENPEYDNLIIDRDVRNVIMFIRSVKDTAIQELNTKKEKGTKRKANAAAKKVSRFGDVGTLDLNALDTPLSLEDFSNFEL